MRTRVLALTAPLYLLACQPQTQTDPGEAPGGPFRGGHNRPYKGDQPDGDAAARGAWRHEIKEPGAAYIALHFTGFDLGDGVLRVSDGQGGQAYELRGKGKMQAGTFWSQHVKGDTTVLELTTPRPLSRPAFLIDELATGPRTPPSTEAICGADDKRPAVCYRESHPTEYQRGRAVARLLSNGSGFCTGWLVGPDNLLITNNHCIDNAAAARDTDYEFAGETESCESTTAAPSKIFSGGELIMTSADLDFTLIRLTGGNPAAEFGYLEIDNRKAVVGEPIYIPGHPGGRLKELSLASTHASDTDGVARVYSLTEPPCMGSGYNDVGYYGDTEGGNSGSPVLATGTHKVIALHHCANCPNRGVPIDLVYAQIADHLVTSKGAVSVGKAVLACAGSLDVLLRDRDLSGEAQAVTVTSSGGDAETLTLAGAGGVYRGAIALAAGAATAGDGALQVAEGETIEVRYEDASVGDGTAATASAGARVDCVAPALTGVAAAARAYAATVTARTDEPAVLRVRHGPSCDALAATASGAAATDHAVEVPGLRPSTTYFFAVDAVDAAGNASTDDNGGACYSLTTETAPDTFFVEEFAGAMDLANSSVTLRPSDTPNRYAMCRGAITALPTDPAGGTAVTLQDDESVQVTPTRPVRVFGREWPSLWIGSNGYVTAERDTGWTPALGAHFGRARVAGLFDDLSPQRGGTVSWQELEDRVAVSFVGVVAYRGDGPSTFQMELFFDGTVRLSWLDVAAQGTLVGLSDGAGTPPGYAPTDFAAAAACQ